MQKKYEKLKILWIGVLVNFILFPLSIPFFIANQNNEIAIIIFIILSINFLPLYFQLFKIFFLKNKKVFIQVFIICLFFTDTGMAFFYFLPFICLILLVIKNKSLMVV